MESAYEEVRYRRDQTLRQRLCARTSLTASRKGAAIKTKKGETRHDKVCIMVGRDRPKASYAQGMSIIPDLSQRATQ